MDRKVKLGLTPAAIVSIVFGVLGSFYLITGLVMQQNPESIEASSAALVFMALGAFMLTTSLILFIFQWYKLQRLQAIFDKGNYILGEVVDITVNYSMRINSQHPFVVLVRYTDPNGNIHIFRSINQKAYPDRSILGKPVKVYIEDERFRWYYIDLEDILPHVIEH